MKTLLVALVRGYQLLLGPWVGGQCRFTPSCSQFTIEALREHGAARGSYLGIFRIARCNPWCNGGHDPVPETFHWAAWRRPSPPDVNEDAFGDTAEMGRGDQQPNAASARPQDVVTPPQV